jgi:2-succinyl-5-enolpyruvyl-6-hydroxy-3-cyclohexene-1-carboxylate synthase
MLSDRLDYIAALFQEADILHWFISPGSRNAPIVAALLRNGHFQLHSFPDERACAFAAMGHALLEQHPAAFLCTSGSALANAYPAVLESYYQRVPLLIVSADRPANRIDQWDGQTIRQQDFFGTYARGSFQIDVRHDPQNVISKGLYDCIRAAITKIPGPAHINLALSEPIYEGVHQLPEKTIDVPAFTYLAPPFEPVFTESLKPYIQGKKVALLIGQHTQSPLLNSVLNNLQDHLPLFADVTSLQLTVGFDAWDWNIYGRDIPDELAPDLIITMGMGLISKPMKEALTRWKPQHLHVGLHTEIGDPFQTEPQAWICHEADFAGALYELYTTEAIPHTSKLYKEQWQTFLEAQPLKVSQLDPPFAEEATFVAAVFSHLNEDCHLHLGNSMTVRYGSWAGKTRAHVFSNRGVSGIDGCLSTAIGDALANPTRHVIAILGDVSSVYDSNALWTDFPPNFHVFILNNSGGRIFDFIKGPNALPELRTFIHTPRSFDFQKMAEFYALTYAKRTFGVALAEADTLLSVDNTYQITELIPSNSPN